MFSLCLCRSSTPYIWLVLRKKREKSWCKLICWQGYAAEERQAPSSSVCDFLFHNESQIPPRPTTILQGPFPTPYWTLAHTHTHTKTQIYADIYMRTHASVFYTQRDVNVCACVSHQILSKHSTDGDILFFPPTMTARLRVWRFLSGGAGVCRVMSDTCFCICKWMFC